MRIGCPMKPTSEEDDHSSDNAGVDFVGTAATGAPLDNPERCKFISLGMSRVFIRINLVVCFKST